MFVYVHESRKKVKEIIHTYKGRVKLQGDEHKEKS